MFWVATSWQGVEALSPCVSVTKALGGELYLYLSYVFHQKRL